MLCSCRTQNMGFQGLIKIIFFGSDKETTKNNIWFHTDSPVIVGFLLGEPQTRMIVGWPDIFPTCQVHDLHDVMDSRQNLGHAATFKKWRSPSSSSWNHQKDYQWFVKKTEQQVGKHVFGNIEGASLMWPKTIHTVLMCFHCLYWRKQSRRFNHGCKMLQV